MPVLETHKKRAATITEEPELTSSLPGVDSKISFQPLLNYLKEKQRILGSSVIKTSHYLIADELHTSRVVVSRLLKQLENDKKIILIVILTIE